MKKTTLEKTINSAGTELRRLLRDCPGERPLEIFKQILERQEKTKSLGSISMFESAMAKEYILGYVALGLPKEAATLANDFNISINWKSNEEFVMSGYSLIAERVVDIFMRSNRMDGDYLNKFRYMRELTGIQIHDETHLTILKAISLEATWTWKKKYLIAVGKERDKENAAGEFYRGKFYPNSENIKDAMRIFEQTGIPPPPEMKKYLADYLERKLEFVDYRQGNGFNIFEKIESCLVLFAENETGKKALSKMPEGIISACFKLEETLGNGIMPVLTHKEIEELLREVFILKGPNIAYSERRYLKERRADMLFDQKFLKEMLQTHGGRSEPLQMRMHRIITALAFIRDRDFLAALLQQANPKVALNLKNENIREWYRGQIENRLYELKEQD